MEIKLYSADDYKEKMYTPSEVNDKQFILLAIDQDVYNAFTSYFHSHKNVTVYFGRFETLEKADCLVSPANSFGLMDGGMDWLIINYFGKDLEQRVQQHIIEDYMGEQPVGTSFIIETNHEKIPYLAHTPTMRTPRDISNTYNVYYAMKAVLNEVSKHPDIKTIAIPALGAGAGRMPAIEVARQMSAAFDHFIHRPKQIDWQYAYNRVFQSEKWRMLNGKNNCN